jgi:hypothetical protein
LRLSFYNQGDRIGVRRLQVNRRAKPVDLSAGNAVIKATVYSGLLDVHCELCGAVSTWLAFGLN